MRTIGLIVGAALLVAAAAIPVHVWITQARLSHAVQVRVGMPRAPIAAQNRAPPTSTPPPLPANTPVPPPTSAPTPTNPPGTSLDAPGVVVTASAFRADSGGDTPPPAGQRYVVTRITVTDDGSASYDAEPLDFSVVDAGDRVAHLAELADPGVAATGLRATTLAPGQSVTGDVAFAVPTTETRVTLYWEPTLTSPEVPVPLGK